MSFQDNAFDDSFQKEKNVHHILPVNGNATNPAFKKGQPQHMMTDAETSAMMGLVAASPVPPPKKAKGKKGKGK